MTAISERTPAVIFRENLRRLLEREWLSQREAANRIGVSYKWLRRLCHQGLARQDCRTVSDLQKVSTFFGLRVSDLWLEATAQKFEPMRGQAVIKWTGSKRRQSDDILKQFPSKIRTYYEPFVGGGSILYRLLESDIPVERYRCSDSCEPLIELWRLIKSAPRRVIDRYDADWSCLRKSGAATYYSLRDEFNETGDPTLFFFLLRTCRNGLVRFNTSGKFTSAFHHGRNGMNPDRVRSVIEDWSRKLQEADVRFYVRDYRRVETRQNDLLYLDPPYAVDKRSRFYSGQIAFDLFFRWLTKQEGQYVLSLNGDIGDRDQRVDVPPDLYDECLQIQAGKSSLARRNTGAVSTVRDSLYLRIN